MRAWAYAVMAAAALALVSTAMATGVSAVGGKIVNSNGQTLEVSRFLNLLPEYVCMVDESQTNVPITDIHSLEHKDGSILMVMMDGKQLMVSGDIIVTMTDFIDYETVNPATGQPEQSEIDCELVNKIEFDWKKAEGMKCPQCGRELPGNYKFCPFDGTKLVPSKS